VEIQYKNREIGEAKSWPRKGINIKDFIRVASGVSRPASKIYISVGFIRILAFFIWIGVIGKVNKMSFCSQTSKYRIPYQGGKIMKKNREKDRQEKYPTDKEILIVPGDTKTKG